MATNRNPQVPPSTETQQTGYDQPTTEQDIEAIAALVLLLLVTEDKEDLEPAVDVLLAPYKLAAGAVNMALTVALSVAVWSPTSTTLTGNAVKVTREAAYYYRAAFILQSAKRVSAQRVSKDSFNSVLAAERRYFKQHLDAMANRRKVALEVDAEAKKQNSELLGWYTVRDNRTSPECRSAHGQNFTTTSMPVIGFPGSVHLHCRCKAGPPHKTKRMLKSA